MTPIGVCEVTIASTTDGTRVVVPGGFGGDGGGYSGSTWMPDESHLLSPDGSDGWLIGDADGSDLVPLAGDSAQAVWIGGGHGYDRPVDLSPDGAQVAYAWGPSVGLRTIALDLWVMSIDGTDRHALTSFEPGAELRAVAWSPDGTRIAFVKGLPGPGVGVLPLQLRSDGAERALAHRPRRIAASDLAPQRAGRAILVRDRAAPLVPRWLSARHRGRRRSVQAGGAPATIDTIIVPIDGSTPAVLKDARRPEWSRDGRSIALVHTTGPDVRREADPTPPATIDVVGFDGSDRHKVTTPTGDLDAFWFIWAAP